MGIFIPLIFITLSCIIIWRASDGFELASNYLGRNLNDGVRGATINAIGSSIPELLTTIFFLLYLKDTEGFSGGIGTTAGSAIFNGMIIPALVIFYVLGKKMTDKIEVSKKVILRDGLSLIIAEAILIILLSGQTLFWWHGLILIFTYVLYASYMLMSMSKNKTDDDDDDDHEFEVSNSKTNKILSILTINLEDLIIGDNKLKTSNSWVLLIVSTVVIGIACLLLVAACELIGSDVYSLPFIGELKGLNIPVMFVAVILASAATSVPDTILSIKDAKNGDYNDAIANALGSNIFDICFALGFPLFMYTIFYGPINLSPDIAGFSTELRIMLFVLTVIAFLVYFVGNYMTKLKAFMLITMYVFFTFYIISRSQSYEWAMNISSLLQSIF